MKNQRVIASSIIVSVIVIILFILLFLPNSKKDVDYIEGIYDRKFKDHVVFYPQHQDDEVLWGGSAIVKAIEQCGVENVYIVLVSDGSGVNVFKNQKYKGLSRKEKKELRDAEFRGALNKLGIEEKNIIILSDLDNKEGTHFELMEKVMIEFENKFKTVTHIAHHYKYDNHPMHRKNGKVLKKLKDRKLVKDGLYFIKPKYVEDIPIDDRVIYQVNTIEEYEKIKNACDEYKVVDYENKKEGIGYTSAHSYFDHLLNDPRFKSVLSTK